MRWIGSRSTRREPPSSGSGSCWHGDRCWVCWGVGTRPARTSSQELPAHHAFARGVYGTQLAMHRDHGRAREVLVAVLAEPEGLPTAPVRLRIVCGATLGRVHGELGDVDEGRREAHAALAKCVDLGDPWLEAVPKALLGLVEHGEGRLEIAEALLHDAVRGFRAAREPMNIALTVAALAHVQMELGQIESARHGYGEAARFLGRWPAIPATGLLFAAWGALEAEHGARAEAVARLESASQSLSCSPSSALAVVVELSQAVMALRLARDAGDPARERVELRRARARLHELSRPQGDAREIASTLAVRFMRRVLHRAVAPRAAQPSPEQPRLVVASGMDWFSVDSGGRVNIGRRTTLRRILSVLLERRATAPGEAVSRELLIGTAWPGDRARPESAELRLRTAVAALRRLGLGPLVLTRDGGYLVDPRAHVTVRDDGA